MMNTKTKLILFSLIFLSGFLVWGKVEAATYTVCSSSCNETTIQAVFNNNILGPNDIVEVRADTVGGNKTYSETVNISSSDDGDATGHVTLQARAGDTITIDGGAVRRQGIVVSGNYVVVDGFNFDNFIPVEGLAAYPVNATTAGATNITIQNCAVNIDLSGEALGVRVGIATGATSWSNKQTNISIINNVVNTDMGSNADQTDGIRASNVDTLLIDGNLVTNSNADNSGAHNDGIQTWNIKEGTIRNNFVNIDQQRNYNQGIYYELYNLGTDEIPTDYGNLLFYNNVIVGYGGSYLFQLNARNTVGTNTIAPTATAEIYNNTIDAKHNSITGSLPVRVVDFVTVTMKNNIIITRRADAPRYAFSVNDSTIVMNNPSIDYNLIYIPEADISDDVLYVNENMYSWSEYVAAGFDTHGIGYMTDPSLDADYVADSATDPPVDSGIGLMAKFIVDKNGVARTGTWDIGAYEYTGTSDIVAPAAPSGLIVS